MNNGERVDFFVENGWTILPGAFTAEQAAPYARRAAERMSALGPQDRVDPDGRPIGCTLTYETCFPLARFAPAAWSLIVDLAGGEDKIAGGSDFSISDGFVVAPPNAGEWKPPSCDGFRWHIDREDDGDRLRLDAMKNGLIAYALWSDVEPRGGGTFLAPGAVPALASYLAGRPKGARFSTLPLIRLLKECDPEFFEMTGTAGTVFLAHPLLIHAGSLNSSSRPRLLSVKRVELREPLRLSGPAAGRTPIERATLRALSRSEKAPRGGIGHAE